jgi:uncharacterized protein YkwD
MTMAAATLPAVPTAAAAPGGCPHADEAPSSVAGARSATLCLLNLERAHRGLRPLRSDSRLQLAATAYSRRMVRQHFFDHVGPDGSTLRQRIATAGYGGWTSIGENLAWGSGSLGTPQKIVGDWMQSPGHRANILQPAFRQIGIGVARGAPLSAVSGTAAVYTTDFARPR